MTFAQHGDVVAITFAAPSRAGQHMSLSLSYHGTPATGFRIANNKYGDRSFVSNDWPNLAHNWLATIDHISMKAPETMSITAPAKYQVISNGLLAQQLDLPNGTRRTTWDEKVPIPTLEFSLAAAPYADDYFGDYHGIALSSWVWPQEHENGLKGFGGFTQPILEFYIDHIGPYSYEKLAQVEANTVGGGMELACGHLLRILQGSRGGNCWRTRWRISISAILRVKPTGTMSGSAKGSAILLRTVVSGEFNDGRRCVHHQPALRQRSRRHALRRYQCAIDHRAQSPRQHLPGHRQQRAGVPGGRAGAPHVARRRGDRRVLGWNSPLLQSFSEKERDQ